LSIVSHMGESSRLLMGSKLFQNELHCRANAELVTRMVTHAHGLLPAIGVGAKRRQHAAAGAGASDSDSSV